MVQGGWCVEFDSQEFELKFKLDSLKKASHLEAFFLD